MSKRPIRTALMKATSPPGNRKRAANIQGRSVSGFVVAAERTVEKTETIRLSAEGQGAFAEALLDPPPPSVGLGKAAKAHRRLIREVR